MRKVNIYSKKRVFNGFLKVEEIEFEHERFDGQMSPRLKRLTVERGDGVAAVVFNRDTRKAVLINQFRPSTYEKGPGWLMEVVAGMIDGDEPPEVAMKREIQEEIGYAVESLEPIATFYLTPGGSTERIFLFYAEISAETVRSGGGGLASEEEDIQAVEFTLVELENLLDAQSILDAKTLIGVQWLLRRFRT